MSTPTVAMGMTSLSGSNTEWIVIRRYDLLLPSFSPVIIYLVFTVRFWPFEVRCPLNTPQIATFIIIVIIILIISFIQDIYTYIAETNYES